MNMASNEMLPTSTNDNPDITRLRTHAVGKPEFEAIAVEEQESRTSNRSWFLGLREHGDTGK